MLGFLVKQKRKTLNHDIETDVLIIGNNITSALTAYSLLDYQIASVVIHKDSIVFNGDFDNHIESESYDLNHLNGTDQHKMELFKDVLGTVYKLDNINEKLKDKIDYYRNPNISYKRENVENGFQLFSGIYYDFGIQINKYKLLKRLSRYLKRHKVGLYSQIEIVFCSQNLNHIDVMTNKGFKIKCKKIINTEENSHIYSHENSINNQYIVNNYHLNNNVLDNLLGAELLINNNLVHDFKLKEKTV